MACLPLATAFVEAFCAQHQVAHADAQRLTLVIEELFTNTVKHGHGGDNDAPVHVALGVDAIHVTLCYEDNARPFNPLQHAQGAPDDIDGSVEERRVGGLGIRLVRQLTEQLDYAHVDGFNRLLLLLKRKA